MNNFRYTIVASPLHDAESIERITAPVRATLAEFGGSVAADPTSSPSTPHIILVATGGTERSIVDIAARRHTVAPHEPVVLVTHALHNSLPAALEALARLRSMGMRGRVVQVAAGTDLANALGDLHTIGRLRGSRLGLVGAPSEWLVASVPDRTRLNERWGIDLVDIDIGATIERHRRTTRDEATPVAVRFTRRGAPDDETLAAAALHPALLDTIEQEHVDAVAVRCFDFLGELATSGCVALAELNDSGLVAGCEGDVASTVAMLLARFLFDQPSWVANPAVIDESTNELLLAHCTVAPSMVNDLELHTHFESGLGIGLRGTFPPGWVTLIRLGGDALERHWFAEAEIVKSGDAPDLCRTQVTLAVSDQRLGSLLEDPLGNHIVMVAGRHRQRLERWWNLAFGDT